MFEIATLNRNSPSVSVVPINLDGDNERVSGGVLDDEVGASDGYVHVLSRAALEMSKAFEDLASSIEKANYR